MMVDDVNIIRELIDVCENYKSINVLTMCDVDFMIESMCIIYIMYNCCKVCFYTIILLCVNKKYYILCIYSLFTVWLDAELMLWLYILHSNVISQGGSHASDHKWS